MQINFSLSGDSLDGGKDFTTNYSVVETPVQTSPTTIPKVSHDLNYDELTSASSENNATIVPESDGGTVYEALNLDNAIIDANGNIEYVSNGLAEFLIKTNGRAKVKYSRVMLGSEATVVNEPTSYVAGSLANHIIAQMDALLLGKTQSNAIQQYVTSMSGTWDNPVVTLNSGIFTDALDFSGSSVTRTDALNDAIPIVLVSDRHAIVARHVSALNREYVFRRTNGTYQKVQVEKLTNFTNSVGVVLDLSLAYLSAPVTGCAIYKTLPEDAFATYCRSALQSEWALNSYFQYISSIPTLRKAMHYADGSWGSAVQVSIISNVFSKAINSSFIHEDVMWNHVYPDNYPIADKYRDWGYIKGVGGDSGGPSFVLINGELILVAVAHTEFSSVDISQKITEINAAMNVQAGTPPGTYALQHPNLSGFTSYLP